MFSPDFLEFTLVFFTYFFYIFFEFLKISKFEFQKMRLNFLTLIVGKYLDIFAREFEKSASKQLSHLHYKNLQILRIAAPQFSLWFRFQLPCSKFA
jgi:hypothetical protein